MLISLTGKARSGKDTVANFLCEKYDFVRIGWADTLKKAVYTLNPIISYKAVYETSYQMLVGYANKDFQEVRLQTTVDEIGWDEAKKIPEVRRLLQVFGTEIGREMFGQNFWVDITTAKLEGNLNYVFVDTRFDNEAGKVVNLGGTNWQILSNRGNDLGTNAGHASEKGISQDLVQDVIENYGTIPELYEKIGQMMSEAENNGK